MYSLLKCCWKCQSSNWRGLSQGGKLCLNHQVALYMSSKGCGHAGTAVGWLCSGAEDQEDTSIAVSSKTQGWFEHKWVEWMNFIRRKKRSSGIFLKPLKFSSPSAPKETQPGEFGWCSTVQVVGLSEGLKGVLSAFNCCSEDCENFKSFHLNHLWKC